LADHTDAVAYCDMGKFLLLNQQVKQLYILKGVSALSSQRFLWDL
jgi:hypothetical protein